MEGNMQDFCMPSNFRPLGDAIAHVDAEGFPEHVSKLCVISIVSGNI